ncbi:MAG: tRNA (guanosine(46)-N7)-methyltransferase TrmB [Chlamydiales bacterium]
MIYAKHLRYPHTWEERKPVLHERVLFVPPFYSAHSRAALPDWKEPELFGKQGKLFIEYCSGNGAWIVQKAAHSPPFHWIAVEKKFDRVQKIWAKMQNAQLGNLLVVCGEAVTFTTHYLTEHSIDGVFINFPDPWPKAKHAKHRLLQPLFVKELARVLKIGGEVTLVTDDPVYALQMIEEMKKNTAFVPHFPAPYFVHDLPNYGASYFDTLWRTKGRAIHYIIFRRCA